MEKDNQGPLHSGTFSNVSTAVNAKRCGSELLLAYVELFTNIAQ